MVVVIGGYCYHMEEQIREDSKSSSFFKTSLTGRGLQIACSLADRQVPVEFLCPISSDGFGLRLLDMLIDKDVLFEPHLCNSPLPSPISISLQSTAVPYHVIGGTAPASLTAKQLLDAFAVNSDIKVVYIEGSLLTFPDEMDAIVKAIGQQDPKPIIYLDTCVAKDSLLKSEKAETLAGIADIIQVDDAIDESILPLSQMTVRLSPYRITFATSSGIREEVVNPSAVDSLEQTVNIISGLYKHDAFGLDGEEPHLQLSEKLCSNVLSSI